MIRSLLSVLFGPEVRVDEELPGMLELAVSMFRRIDEALWTGKITDELRAEVYEQDIELNQLERALRQSALTHLAVREPRQITSCLVLFSVAKDTERIGDYVKNLMAPVLDPAPVPEGELKARVRRLGVEIGEVLDRVSPVFQSGDEEEAEALIRKGRALAGRCEAIVAEVSAAELPSRATVSLVLIARFYKRIAAHATNILSSIIMPVHKIDYFDEEALEPESPSEPSDTDS